MNIVWCNNLSSYLSQRVFVTQLNSGFIILRGKIIRSSYSEVFLGKVFLKICSKFTGEHPYGSAILIKLQSNFIGVFSCKFAAYFQNIFSTEHLWMAASGLSCEKLIIRIKNFEGDGINLDRLYMDDVIK